MDEFVKHCVSHDWDEFFGTPEVQEAVKELSYKLLREARRQSNPGIEPPMPLVFEAFNRVSPKRIKVVIIGEGPTPQIGQSTGLAFSVDDPKSVESVLNVLLELSLEGFPVNLNNGDLTSWTRQGVFLLNAALTVNRGQAGSHSDSWSLFTEMLVQYISDRGNPSAWLLWGEKAQYFQQFIDTTRHYVMTGGHPSPPGRIRRNEFFGRGYFLCANEFLANKRGGRIDWALASRNVLEPCPPM